MKGVAALPWVPSTEKEHESHKTDRQHFGLNKKPHPYKNGLSLGGSPTLFAINVKS